MISSETAHSSALAELLGSQLSVMQELRGVMQIKQRLLVGNDTESLAELSHREEALASRLHRLEQQRSRIVSTMCGLDQAQLSELPAGELRELLGGDDPQLSSLTSELRTLIDELQLLQDDNRILTTRLLEYGSLVLKLITQGEEQTGYTNLGRPAEGLQRRDLLNCSV
jgi:flagellar biosynthesis/type III secretory pathway chaperone